MYLKNKRCTNNNKEVKNFNEVSINKAIRHRRRSSVPGISIGTPILGKIQISVFSNKLYFSLKLFSHLSGIFVELTEFNFPTAALYNDR